MLMDNGLPCCARRSGRGHPRGVVRRRRRRSYDAGVSTALSCFSTRRRRHRSCVQRADKTFGCCCSPAAAHSKPQARVAAVHRRRSGRDTRNPELVIPQGSHKLGRVELTIAPRYRRVVDHNSCDDLRNTTVFETAAFKLGAPATTGVGDSSCRRYRRILAERHFNRCRLHHVDGLALDSPPNAAARSYWLGYRFFRDHRSDFGARTFQLGHGQRTDDAEPARRISSRRIHRQQAVRYFASEVPSPNARRRDGAGRHETAVSLDLKVVENAFERFDPWCARKTRVAPVAIKEQCPQSGAKRAVDVVIRRVANV